MARLYYVLSVLLWGFAKAEISEKNVQHAIIEDLRSNDARIVGGWPAADGQIPFQAHLRMVSALGSVGGCGGSLIHHHWVISAAHCLVNRYTFVVRLGLTNLTRPEWVLETHHAELPPVFDAAGASVQTHDIGLVRLPYYVPYGPTIQPVRLQSTEQKNFDYHGVVLTISGYGRRDDPVNAPEGGWTASEVLLWVHLRGITSEECLQWYTNSTVIAEQTLCAEYYNDTSQSACQGDSGGPLTVVDLDGKPTMVGIASFVSSAGCNSPYPSGYVRPGHYHGWYREVTGLDFDWSLEDLHSGAASVTGRLLFIILAVLFIILS